MEKVNASADPGRVLQMSLYSLQLAAGTGRSKWSPHCQRCTTSYRTKSACWLVGRKPQSFDWTLSKFSSSVIPMCGCYTSVNHGIRHLVFFFFGNSRLAADRLRLVQSRPVSFSMAISSSERTCFGCYKPRPVASTLPRRHPTIV